MSGKSRELSTRNLIIILGPTASGKTRLAIELALALNTEIISADSRQFFREIPIGSAAPDREEMKGIQHHFIGHLSILDSFNVYQYEKQCLDLLSQLFQSHNSVVMVGGSGLYIDAVCYGIDDMPDIPKPIREKVEKEFREGGLPLLQEKVQHCDPDYFAIVDKKNPVRLQRALEVWYTTGKPFSSFRKNQKQKRPFRILKIGLSPSMEALQKLIEQRTTAMIRNGLEQEARDVYPYKSLNALKTVGFKEMFAYFRGELMEKEVEEHIIINTRKYAKRQLTWFRRYDDIHWFDPEDKNAFNTIIQTVFSYIDYN